MSRHLSSFVAQHKIYRRSAQYRCGPIHVAFRNVAVLLYIIMSSFSDNSRSSSSEQSSSSSSDGEQSPEIVKEGKQRSRSTERSSRRPDRRWRSRSSGRSRSKSKKKKVEKQRKVSRSGSRSPVYLRAREIPAKAIRGRHAKAAHVRSRDLNHGIDQNGASSEKKRNTQQILLQRLLQR